jgi:hypothetical protein
MRAAAFKKNFGRFRRLARKPTTALLGYIMIASSIILVISAIAIVASAAKKHRPVPVRVRARRRP